MDDREEDVEEELGEEVDLLMTCPCPRELGEQLLEQDRRAKVSLHEAATTTRKSMQVYSARCRR